MVNVSGDLDDQDEDNDGHSGPKQKKFSFLPAFGTFSSEKESQSLRCSRYNTHDILQGPLAEGEFGSQLYG